jgi:hypothetical protein
MPQLSSDWITSLGEPYLPGAGRDAPRVHFEDIKRTIPKRVDADALRASPAMDLARQLYTARYFWEAHEVLDYLARAALPGGKPLHMLEGLKHLANACLKVRLRQPNAAVRHVRDAERHFADAHGLEVPLDLDGLRAQCDGFRTAIQTGDVGEALMERPSLDGWSLNRS